MQGSALSVGIYMCESGIIRVVIAAQYSCMRFEDFTDYDKAKCRKS